MSEVAHVAETLATAVHPPGEKRVAHGPSTGVAGSVGARTGVDATSRARGCGNRVEPLARGGEAGPSDAERLLRPLWAGEPGRGPLLLALRRTARAGRGRAARREHFDDLAGRYRPGRGRVRGTTGGDGGDRGPAGRYRSAAGETRPERGQPVP